MKELSMEQKAKRYADNLDEATLYKLKFNAKRIANIESNVTKVEVKEVKVTIEIE